MVNFSSHHQNKKREQEAPICINKPNYLQKYRECLVLVLQTYTIFLFINTIMCFLFLFIIYFKFYKKVQYNLIFMLNL